MFKAKNFMVAVLVIYSVVSKSQPSASLVADLNTTTANNSSNPTDLTVYNGGKSVV